MSGAPDELERLGDDVKSSWHRWLDIFEPLRPELYRYCRHLTRSPWDAEDLVQDALMRAFVTLGTMFRDIPNPRAWIFRVASNLWIDRMRRSAFEHALELPPTTSIDPDSAESHDAARTLFARLAPRERAAVVLKDVFDFSLEEVADALSTTPGAVKSALHRGRGKLESSEAPPRTVPVPAALDAFCAAFNTRDLERLTQLLLDNSTVEIVGIVTEYGREAPRDAETGSLAGTLSPITFDERGGVPPELLAGYLGTSPRCEPRAYRDGWILVFWYEHDQGPHVRTVMTAVTDGERIRHLRNYFFTPDVIAEVCQELGVPYRVNGYRYWQ